MANKGFKVDPKLLRTTTTLFDIPHPHFIGNCSAPFGTITREQRVMQALLDVYARLNGGCIRDNTALDTSVDAFKDGHLSRKEVWDRLIADFHSLNNITFDCQEYRNDNVWASWTFNSSTITVFWTTDSGPSNYAVLHEFVHKSGFNDNLQQWYPHDSIENQTYLVASSCFS